MKNTNTNTNTKTAKTETVKKVSACTTAATDFATTASLRPVVKILEGWFDKANTAFYNGELEKPVVTIQANRRSTGVHAFGWFTAFRGWKSGADADDDENAGKVEINICPETLNRTPAELLATLLHEMAHEYAFLNGVKDTSRQGQFHNEKYADIAAKHGLKVEKGDKYGWHKTSLNPVGEKFLKTLNADIIAIHYHAPEGKKPTAAKEKTPREALRKMQCPVCKASARAAESVILICGKCHKEMLIQD